MEKSYLVILIFSLISCKDTSTPSRMDHEEYSKHYTDSLRGAAKWEGSLDSMKLAAEENYLRSKTLVVVSKKVIFDLDFRPTLVLQLRNNMDEGVKAFEIILDPTSDEQKCESVTIRRKTSIPRGKTVTVKEKLTSDVEPGCLKIENAKVRIGDFILASGRRTNDAVEFFDNISKSD